MGWWVWFSYIFTLFKIKKVYFLSSIVKHNLPITSSSSSHSFLLLLFVVVVAVSLLLLLLLLLFVVVVVVVLAPLPFRVIGILLLVCVVSLLGCTTFLLLVSLSLPLQVAILLLRVDSRGGRRCCCRRRRLS